MPVSIRQQVRVGSYLFKQKLKKREKFPLLVELEPLFACNLACAGCGKIQYPAHLLKRRMSVEQAVAGIQEERVVDRLGIQEHGQLLGGERLRPGEREDGDERHTGEPEPSHTRPPCFLPVPDVH